MSLPEILQKRWLPVAIIGLLFFIGVLFAGISLMGKESFATLHIQKINKTAILPGEKIIISNESDFKDLPQLASIILNNDPNSMESTIVLFSGEEYLNFKARFWTNLTPDEDEVNFPPKRVLEYKGKYFEYDYPWIH